MPHWLHALLYPKPPVAALVVVSSCVLVVVALTTSLSRTPLAWFAYLYSAWGLAIAIAWVIRAVPRARDRIIARGGVLSRLITDARFRSFVSLCAGSVIDVAYVAINTAGAISMGSGWFGALSFYYFVLTLVNVHLIYMHRDLLSKQGTATATDENDKNLADLRSQRTCGYILLLVNIGLAVIIYGFRHGGSVTYPYFLIYGVALYAFVCLGTSIAGFASKKGRSGPTIYAMSAVNLVKAIASMYFLEMAMMATFGDNFAIAEGLKFWTSIVACTAVLIIPLWMIVKATREIKQENLR